MNLLSRIFLFVLLFFLAGSSFSQTSTTERFGQNRVQYKDFIFSYYESDNFVTYFYQGGQDLAKFVIKAAEDDADDISKLLDYRYKKKIDIIVYNTIGELNQTNIGIYDPSQTSGGTVKIPDGKIFVYFNGDHNNLEKQIREGIARVFIEKMVTGTGFAEVIQNAVLLNLPDWYKLGLSQYIGESWNSDMEDRLRDGILSGRYKMLNKLAPEEAIFVGHSIWHYIEETHGKTALSNVVYLTRINRSVDNGFLFVLGTTLSQTLEMWYTYYHDRFTSESKADSLPPEQTIVKTKIRKGLNYYESRLSADGKHIAYASNNMGRYKVHVVTLGDKKKKVALTGGFRTNTIFTDASIPLIAWDPSGKKLTMIREKRGKIFMIFYDVETHKKEVNPIRKFQKVLSFSYVNSKQLVMSAVQNGQTDIFLYNIASTTTRKITDDYYDDLNPAYVTVDSMQGIMFSSNREDETLEPKRYESQVMSKNYDLFFYDLDANGNTLYRVTSTPFANENYPQNLNDSAFCFLSDKNGIRNRYTGHFEKVFDYYRKTYRFVVKESGDEDSVQVRQNIPLDSAIDKNLVDLKDSSIEKVYKIAAVTSPVTDYGHSILEQSVVGSKSLTLDLFRIKNKPQFRVYSLDSITALPTLPLTGYMTKLQSKPVDEQNTEKKKSPVESKLSPAASDSIRKLKSRPFDFQSEFDYGIKLFDWDSATASKLNAAQNGYVFRFSKVRPYFVRFSLDKVIAQVDDNPIVTRYQLFDPSSPQYNAEPVSFAFKFGITDLLENYKIYGGIRFPFSSLDNSGEYFITYENLKKRLDKKITFYRKSVLNTTNGTLPFSSTPLPSDILSEDYSIKTNYLELALNYPLDVLNSFRFIFGFRNDKVIYKSEDSLSLHLPPHIDNWLSARTEYVFDNCLEVMTNIRYGARFKAYAEIQKEIPGQTGTLFNQFTVPFPTINNKFFTVVGFDARYYLKVYRQIIWANRISGAASFGTDHLLFLMGGLDSWIVSSFDNSTPINTKNNYAYETLATPLRGFDQNARNGDKFVLINSELRIPVFTVLSNSPLKSELLRNFQILGFFDAGTAWEGLSPFSNNNPLFNQVIPNSPENPTVLILLKQYRNPIIFGFGPGVRTSLFGFFLKLDAAWGYDTGVLSTKPTYYFSFGLDF